MNATLRHMEKHRIPSKAYLVDQRAVEFVLFN